MGICIFTPLQPGNPAAINNDKGLVISDPATPCLYWSELMFWNPENVKSLGF